MDQNRVRELIALLPPGAAYPATPHLSPFRPRPNATERFALALRDPAFGASFVGAFIEKRRWLPDSVREWPLLQLFLTRVFKVTEPLMLEVESFRTETRHQERDVLDALLLAEDITLAEIATLLNTSEEIVEAYEAIHWNLRDRKHEHPYLNALLYPAGWQAAMRDTQPNAVGDRLRLLRAGASNDVDEVLALAGYQSRSATGAFSEDGGEVERRIQQDALRRMRAGCGMEDQVVRAAHSAAVRRKEIALSDDELALHNINAVLPALDEIRKHSGRNAPPPPDYELILDSAKAKAAPTIQHLLRKGAGDGL